MTENVLGAAEQVWEYMRLGDEASDADCMLVLGSRDDRVATYAATLVDRLRFQAIVISGGVAPHNDHLRNVWDEATEAQHFHTVIKSHGQRLRRSGPMVTHLSVSHHPPHTLQSYCNQDQQLEDIISIMVGDLQRIIEYPAKGFQSH